MPFKMQEQEQTRWCWAAVSVSVEKYFFPTSTLTQCQLAKEVISDANADCCRNPDSCNGVAKLQDALHKIEERAKASPIALRFPDPSKPMSFFEVKAEIDSGMPVGVRMEWAGLGAHFLVISGYWTLSGQKLLEIGDPLFGEGTVDFDWFSTSYFGGQWTHTFTMQA